MKKVFAPLTTHDPNPCIWRFLRATVALLFLFVTAGIGAAFGANLLTNPGFESGITGWSGVVRGATVSVVTNASAAHGGSNYVSATGLSTGWASVSQGDALGGYSTGVSLPVSDAKFYKLSAYVKVPGASTTPQAMSLRYRFEPSGSRVDVGTKSVSTEDWTLLESGWLSPAAGDIYVSYWEIHSNTNGITFYADDCALEEAAPLVLNGRVVDSGGAGVDNATASATSPGYSSPSTVTSGGGYYTMSVPPGTYTVSANTPGFKGSCVVTVSASPTTAPNIVLAVDPDYDPDLVFSLRSSALGASGPWPASCPAGTSLTRIGAPTVETIRGQQWAKNSFATGDGYRFTPAHGVSIPCSGATVVAVVKHIRTAETWWSSIVNCFYNALMLNVRNTDGRIQATINDWPGADQYDGPTLADGQEAVISAVVQPDGTIKVYLNGVGTALTKPASSYTEITAGGTGSFTYGQDIDVGRNDPDAWTTFNGDIGDVYLYKVALSDTKRAALEASLLSKFSINTNVYTIAASVSGSGGTISPAGAVGVPAGTDKTFVMTPQDVHYTVKSVVVDGVDQGPITSYTFKNVLDNSHSIVASFKGVPTTVVSGRVTDGTNGIMGATVYFKSSANASVAPNFTTSTTTYDGNYSVAVLPGSWYVAAGANLYDTSADVAVVLGSIPATLNFTLTKQASSLQPMLVSKGLGAARTDLSGMVGYTFTTSANPIKVTKLGFVDWEGDGFLTDHSIGIWQGNDLVSSATVTAGTSATKVGDFRYADANPALTLEPYTTYVIGANVISSGDKWPDTADSPGLGMPDFSGITGLASRRHDTEEFVLPEIVWVSGQVGAACNLIGQVEPAPSVKVKGVVKDAFGVGINNAVVQIGGIGSVATVTDANGKYQLFDVPIGSAEEVYADGLGYADNTSTVDTSTAATVPVVKDITLTGKVETGVITNGGFENGLSPWYLSGGSQQVGVTNVEKYSGSYAGYWKSTAALWYDSYLWYDLPVIAGSTYNVYFKLKTDAPVGQCGFDFLDANGGEAPWWGYAGGLYAGANWMYTTVPGKWEQVLNYRSWDDGLHTVGVRMTPPDGTVSIRIVAGLGPDAVGQVLYIDDVVIDRVGPDAAPGPFTIGDVVGCLRWAGGLSMVPQNNLTRYDVVANGRVDVADALRIARKVAGVDANP